MDPNSDVSECPILGRLPSKLGNRLLPFQKEGVRYAVGKNGRCLIADEMGLGKTIQAIAVAYYYKDEWPLLIIVPSSLKFCWIEELEKWLPDILPHQINLVQCGNDASGLATSLINIVTYGLLRLPSSKVMREAITACKFKIIICDESHYLKNIKTLSSKTIIPLLKSTSRRILLSGTPALAKPVELYPQIDAICPGKFGSFWQYTDRYCNAHTVYYGKFKKRVVDGASNLEELQQRLKNMLMIRREKSEVLTELPPKQRQRVLFELKQSTLKKEILDKFAELKQRIHKGSKTLQQVLQGAESSSHVADAEGLEQEKNDENLATDEPNTSVHSQISKLYKLSGEAKIGPVREYIEMLCDNEQLKFLVFAFHHDMMDGVQQTLWEKKVKFVRIDGHTKGTDRQAFVHQFQSDPDTRVAILSILAAGVGLTFTAAKLVVFAELYWTPGVMVQCEDRAHRIGQTCSLPVHYLVARGTMDEWVWSAVCKKTVVTSTALTGKSRQLEHNEGDKYQVDLLSNADVWNPEEGETLVNVSQLFQTQRPDDQSSILEFFPSQRDPDQKVGCGKPTKHYHEADSTKTIVNTKNSVNGDQIIGKSKVTDETKLKAKSRKRDKQSRTTAVSKSNKLKVPDILIISDDEDEFKPAVKKKRVHDNLCQKKSKNFNKLNVQRDTNTTSEAVSKEEKKGVSTLKSYMNRYDLDFEGETEAEMKSADEEPFDGDGLAITNSEKCQHGGSCGDEADGSNTAVTESCLSQLSDSEAYSENKDPIMSQAYPSQSCEGNSSQQAPHVDSRSSQSPEIDREVNSALNDNSMSPTHLSSPSRREQMQQTPQVNKCKRCISNSEKIPDDGKASSETNQWSCATCTFLNHSELPQCEMCDTPKRKGSLRKSQTDRPKSSESSPDTDGEGPNLPPLTSKNCQIGLNSHNLDVDFVTAHDELLNPEPDICREDKFTMIRKGTKPEEITSKSEASTTIHHVHEEMQHTSLSVTTSRIAEISADICDNEVSSINSLPSSSISTVNQMKVMPNTVVQDLQGQCESPDLFDDDVDAQENAVIECDGKSAEGEKSPVIEDFDSEESDIEDLTSHLSNSAANCAQLPVSNSSLAIPATTDKSLQVHLPTSSNVITVTSCVTSLPSAASLQSSSAQLPSPSATTSVLDNISAFAPLANDLEPPDEITVSQISQKNCVSGKTDVQSQQTQDPTHKELKFSCSVHTGRIYVYDKGGNSLNANFHPVDVEVGNTSDLAEILQIPQHLRLLQKFIREWSSLTDNKKRMIAKRGLIFTSPLAAYEEVKTVQGSKQRHLSKEDNLATAMRNASRVQGSVRVISKHSACPVNITTEFQEKDLSSVRGIAQTVTENGVPLCLQCHQPYSNPLLSSETISKPENAWQFRLCSYACMDKYWTLTKASYCRDQIYAVERGVCRICHYDAHAFFQQIKITKDITTKAELIKKSPYNSLTSKQRQKMVEQPQAGQFWHVDHITPVWQGGGMCDLDNLRTLCTPCHLKVTRRQAGQRATMKKLSGAASQGDITAFFQKS